MKQRLLSTFVLVCVSSIIAAPQSNPQEPKDQLNRGIQDYKAAQFESAVEHLKQARQLDPQSRRAALYLAASLAQEYIPGVETPDNLRLGNDAIEAYKQVLVLDSQNVNALKSIATLELLMKRFREARDYYLQAAQAAPNDPQTFYCVGVVDWVQAYKQRALERSKRGLGMDRPSTITQPFCRKLRAANLPLIEAGMQALNKAVELRPDYDDAMAYLSLLYRERAEIQCSNKAARLSDEQQGDRWIDKGLEARKHRAENSDEQASEKSTAADDLEPPPPPPPPPIPPVPPPPPPPRPR